MPQHIEVNGQVVEFPDGMSTDDIGAAIKKNALTIPSVAKSSPMANPVLPRDNESMWDSFKSGAGNLTMGLTKGLADPVYGLSQLALHGLNKAGLASDKFTQDYDQRLREIEDQYQTDTPGSVPAGIGRLTGNIAFPLKGATLLKGATPMVRAVNAAGTGAAIGSMQPVTNVAPPRSPDGSDFWASKGLQVGAGAFGGGALSMGGSALGGAWNAVRPLVAPKSAAGNLILKGVKSSDANVGGLVNDPASVLTRIDSSGPILPGSLPTTAQVAGIPSLVMAEKTLKNNPAYRVPFEERSINNNAVRMKALRDIAGTPAELEDAIAARKKLTGPLYDDAAAEVHAVSPELQAILDRPSAQSAIARGQRLAAERGEEIGPQGGRAAIPEQQVPLPVLNADGQPFTRTVAGSPAIPPSVDGKTLQYLKMGIDDLQKEGAQTGMGAHEAAALGATRNDLDNWLIGNSPTFKAANQTFADASIPINTMQAGQSILGALEGGTLNASGDVAPMLSQFRNQYAKALKNSPYGIDSEAQKTLDAIQSDLQRETVSNSLRSSGSDTAFNLQAPNWLSGKLFGEGLDGKSMLGRGLGAVGGFLTGGPMGAAGGVVAAQKLGSIAGNRVNGQLQQAMLDPAYFAQLLREASARQQGGLLSNVPAAAGAVGGDDALGLLGR